jgi:hypothetical protein
MSHYYNKFLSIHLKTPADLVELTNNHIYQIKTGEEEKKLSLEELTIWMQETISFKNGSYFVSHFHAKVVQKLYWALKGNHSHAILVSNFNNGCRTIAKMAGWLLDIGVNDFKNTSVGGLL